MKRLLSTPYLMVVSLVLGLMACDGKQSPTSPSSSSGEFEESAGDASSIQRMHDYHFSDTLRAGGHLYAYTIDRTASDSLPMVKDDEGICYADNVYSLKIRRDGAPFFSRRFTKAAFGSYLSADFRAKGLLDGLMCDKSLPGLNFAVSISLPQSDMIEPLLLHVDPSGGISIERDTRADNDIDE